MSDPAKIELCIIWENELRQAARLMREAFAHAHSNQAETAERAEIYTRAILATHTALHDLTDDRICVILGPETMRIKEK